MAMAQAQQHPWDPHAPNFSRLVPRQLRPYPSFEGWYARVVDPQKQFSAAVVMATNYATEESQVTMLFSTSPQSTRVYASITKDACFKSISESSENAEPKGFEWEAPGLAAMIMKPHESHLEVNLKGFQLKLDMDHEVPWSPNNTEEGPEGWVGKVPWFPCHWYVYSLASRASYTLQQQGSDECISGVAFAHQEKNWGETFPSGHVWLQGITPDGTSQLLCSGAFFKLGKLETHFVFALGFRSLQNRLDLRSNDLGVIFKDMHISPLEGRFSITGVGPSHTFKIESSAPPGSFSEPMLAPIGKLDWKPACRESFVATIVTQLYEHSVWGIASEDKLVETQTFQCAALEFGEDLLEAALQEKQRSET